MGKVMGNSLILLGFYNQKINFPNCHTTHSIILKYRLSADGVQSTLVNQFITLAYLLGNAGALMGLRSTKDLKNKIKIIIN
jgi:hypothetical protein